MEGASNGLSQGPGKLSTGGGPVSLAKVFAVLLNVAFQSQAELSLAVTLSVLSFYHLLSANSFLSSLCTNMFTTRQAPETSLTLS